MSILDQNINPYIPNILDFYDVRIVLRNFHVTDWEDWARSSGQTIQQNDYREAFRNVIRQKLTHVYVPNRLQSKHTVDFLYAELLGVLVVAWNIPSIFIRTEATYSVVVEGVHTHQHLARVTFKSILGTQYEKRVTIMFIPKPRQSRHEYP